MKRGIYFTLDALFGALLIGLALVLSSQYFISEATQPQVNYYSQDIVNSLSNIKISEVNDTYVKYLISSGQITYLNNTVIEQIGEFYVLNKTGMAENLSEIVSRKLVPEKFGFEILVNDESVYHNSGITQKKDLVSSRRLISGIEKFKPLRGATSKVFLEGINKKKYSSYVYFGGFVGQGNLSVYQSLPSDVNITEVYIEFDSASNFKFYINGDQCGGVYSIGSGTMTADGWDISSCNSSLVLGTENNYTLEFLGNLGESFVGGGFIRTIYDTNKLQQEKEKTTIREKLPGISGIINLYSSFYVPGSLTNISVYLHYFADATNQTNNTFYFTIGNETIYKDNNLTGEKTHLITPNNISDFVSFSLLDQRTVPIRTGFENVSFGFIYEGNADVALITDVSGSMDWRMDNNNNGNKINCDDPGLNLSSTSRLSVAKCLDKQFSQDIINISGNRVGLVSYDASTHGGETRYPTRNYLLLNSTIGRANPETGYEASGSTCICCGINTAKDILTENVSVTTLISINEAWLVNNFSLNAPPGPDPSGNQWYDRIYSNESDWNSGNAILGATNGYSYSPSVDTEIGSDLSGNTLYANLWENQGDTPGAPNDFSSGTLNSTGNTFGISGSDDGWDWQSGTYDYSDSVRFDEVSNERLQIYSYDNNDPVSGAYGIEVEITSEMYDVINSENSRATLSFNYRWDESGGFEGYEDQVWIKGRWESPTSGSHWLGEDLDASTDNPDSYEEIDVRNDPDADITNGYYSQDLSGWIESSGNYYLELGGKLLRDYTNEEGYFRFDNIQIEISNKTDHYYFRKHFTISNIDDVQKGVLNVLSDDMAKVYLNGVLVDSDLEEHDAEYWNRRGENIAGDRFRAGDNVIAVELFNSEDAAKFDLELLGLNESRDLAMMVMTDGVANEDSGCPQSGTPTEEAIEAACDAREDYGIKVYAVGFSDNADESTLQGIAACGEGIYRKSNNISALQEFYSDVASSIISASRHSQTIEVEGNITNSILFDDSYIELTYNPVIQPPQFGEISIVVEEKNFDNCTFDVYIPPDIRVSDAKLTSYSAEHWTDALIVNNNQVYNLSTYSPDYTSLGDPFLVNIPVSTLQPGNNTLNIRTGDAPDNYTECSVNNTFIYTAQIKASVSYSDVLEKAVGCSWLVEFEDGDNTTVNVPPDYAGAKNCYYTPTQISYDANDTYDDAMYNLLDNLDFDDDGRIYVNIKESNLVVGAISVGKIPYPWGPAIAEVRVWK